MTHAFQRQAGRISQPQLIAMTVILALGVVSGAYILRGPGSPEAAEEAGHAEHDHGKDHEGDHDKDHAEAKGPDDKAPHEEGKGHEGQEPPVSFSADQIKTAGIAVEAAAEGLIRNTVSLPGEVRFNEDRTAHVVPRVAGVVEYVQANLGQQVRRGQVLAVISSVALSDLRSEHQAAQQRLALARTTYEREKKLFDDKVSAQMDFLQAQQAWREAEIALTNVRQKLQALGASPSSSGLNRYELRAPFDAMVVEKHLALGESVKEDANVFTLSDLSTVWAEVSVPAKDLARVRVGDSVRVRASSLDSAVAGKVAYVSALIGEQSRTATARVVLPNPQGAWRPGLFVNVEVLADEVRAPVTVAASAVQAFEGREVVFLEVPGGFQATTVQVGRTDGQRTEITQGLKAGQRHAAANSFVIKAEIGKASAEHEH